MSNDDETILGLIRENERLKQDNKSLRKDISTAESYMRKAGVPDYFEDGNDGDDLSFTEQMSIFYNMYQKQLLKTKP